MEDKRPTAIKVQKSIDNISFPKKPSSYNYLKKINPDHKIVKAYDKALAIFEKKNISKKNKSEKEIIEKKEVSKKINPVNELSVKNLFLKQFQIINDKKFDINLNDGEPNVLLWTLLTYFSKNKKFYDSPILNKNINNPDLKKGLLIIGYPGVGKTAIFKAFYKLFFNAQIEPYYLVKDINNNDQYLFKYKMFFKYFHSNMVVEDYENCLEPEEKETFWIKHNSGICYYDDLLTERQVSNFGKFELFKEIIEKREQLNLKTYASCNHYGNGLEDTLNEFNLKYGSRVYDRIFSMFNILNLSGKSLRR